jgi:hypothetical protein
MTTTNLSLSLHEGATNARPSMTPVTHDELVNLDITLAEYIAPRLRAFANTTEAYPADLPNLDAWKAELARMAVAFENIHVLGTEAWPDHVEQADLDLFAARLGHLWL